MIVVIVRVPVMVIILSYFDRSWARPHQVAELECACDEIVDLESRAEMAENERDELAAQVRCLTPRPGPNAGDFLGRLGEQGGRDRGGRGGSATLPSNPASACPLNHLSLGGVDASMEGLDSFP